MMGDLPAPGLLLSNNSQVKAILMWMVILLFKTEVCSEKLALLRFHNIRISYLINHYFGIMVFCGGEGRELAESFANLNTIFKAVCF